MHVDRQFHCILLHYSCNYHCMAQFEYYNLLEIEIIGLLYTIEIEIIGFVCVCVGGGGRG